jgi:hypothetical protein
MQLNADDFMKRLIEMGVRQQLTTLQTQHAAEIEAARKEAQARALSGREEPDHVPGNGVPVEGGDLARYLNRCVCAAAMERRDTTGNRYSGGLCQLG